jgi:hypothetical protein
MPIPALTSQQRAPQRGRYLIPIGTPRRGELVAALATAAVLAHLVLAQVALVFIIAFQATSRLSRWRPQWLMVPAAAGLGWALAIGPATAAARFAAGPRQVLGYFAGSGGHPGRILHPAGAFAGLAHWLPGQLPLALVLAAAEAGALWWLDWLHGTEPAAGQARPGLVVALRRRWTAASIRSGGVVTRDGGCVGIETATGRAAAISWQEAEGGVLCTAPVAPPGALAAADAAGLELAETCFMLAHAGIRRRKPVIIIDLTGSGWLADPLAAACAAAGAPLRHFSSAGPGFYEPFRGGDPAQAASLVAGLVDWAGTPDQHRRTCTAYLTDAFAVLAAAPADPRLPVLDDLAGLLTPAALLARLRRVPAYHPRRAALADRVEVSVRQAEADPAALSEAAAALPGLRASALGQWLAPEPAPRPGAPDPGGTFAAAAGQAAEPGRIGVGQAPGLARIGQAAGAARAGLDQSAGSARISLGQVVRDRAVAAFWLDRAVYGQSATMIASLAASDLMAVCTELSRIPVAGDALAWIHGCEALEGRLLTELVATGAGAGLAVLLSTTSAAAVERLSETVNVLLACGPADPAVAARFTDLAGPATAPGATGTAGLGTAVPPGYPLRIDGSHPVADQSLLTAGHAEFGLLVKRPRARVLPLCRSVRGAATWWRR